VQYLTDSDEALLPASIRIVGITEPTVWPPLLLPYVKDKAVFVIPATDGTFASDWVNRRNQNVGYNEATSYEQGSTVQPGQPVPPGTEGFPTVAYVSALDEPSRIGLFATTPNSKTGKERGYVFNPYNGPADPGGNLRFGLPLISDTNLCADSPLAPAFLKPIFARQGADGKGSGTTPVIFADGHAASYSATKLNRFGPIIWRFR
jgi:hypothetical protein